MSVTGRVGIGIPTVLLHEGEGHTITVESKHGEIYRGFLHESEDNMNVFMKNVTYTNKNGKTSKLEQVSCIDGASDGVRMLTISLNKVSNTFTE